MGLRFGGQIGFEDNQIDPSFRGDGPVAMRNVQLEDIDRSYSR